MTKTMTKMTVTATAKSEGKPQQRERGTLKHTLPRRPIVLVALVCVVSAALATALFRYSSRTGAVDENGVAKLGFGAFLGAASTSVGILLGDSLSHAFAFGVTVRVAVVSLDAHTMCIFKVIADPSRLFLQLLFVDYSDIKSSILAASPPLIMSALASSRGPRSIISSLDSSFLFQPIVLRSFCLVPFLTLANKSITHGAYLNISTIPLCTVAFVALVLMHAYGKHRAHKNGDLLTGEMKSQAVFAGMSILLSCSIIMESNPGASKDLVVFLLGSLFVILISHTFASVADTWYTVGSGQFQMCSLDAAGMMFYFMCPVVILHLRFLDKYGESIGSKSTLLKEYLQSSGVLSVPVGDGSEADVISFSLVMTLAMITAVGVPLLNALCPMGGYLFSRAYTHGQPNTKKVALCVNFSTLPRDSNERIQIWKSLEKKKTNSQKVSAVLNIFVTLEDLTLFSTELKSMAEKGHTIALAPSEFHETLCGLSLFQGTKSSCNIENAQIKVSPWWMGQFVAG